MSERTNDIRAKRLRAQLRTEGRPCHACGKPIDYDAHHHDPLSFQLDHLWQVDLGGPAYDYDNCGSSHRSCNRARSNRIDHITVTAAARYGVTIPLPADQLRDTTNVIKPPCAPDGQDCAHCNGTHNPTAGVTFITARDWWTVPA